MGDIGLLHRWLRFNGVGALGAGVQLALLAGLTRGADLHYLWATAIAVEASVLHNFWWHERWTWRERPARSRQRLLDRLVRFHMSNGAISLAGNLLLMRVLAGSLGVAPIAASILAILVCSLVNFGASEWLVFKRAAVTALLVLALEPLHAASPAADFTAVELRPQTVAAWKVYEERVDTRYEAPAPAGTPFFALDAFHVKDWRAAAGRGTVTMSRIGAARPGDGEISMGDGKIHHWAGAIFVPGAAVPDLLDRLAALAGHEQDHYEDVLASRLLSSGGDHYRIFMKIHRSKYITVTYNTEHDVRYRRLGPTRATARSVATRIAQLDDVGTPREHELKMGADGGYLWRLNAYWRYEAVNGGVMIECESLSLSRSIPVLLRPFATGAVEGVARESLERTLTGLRKYLTARPPAR